MDDVTFDMSAYASREQVVSVSRTELLLLHALSYGPLSRQEVDGIVGQQNGPDAIYRLRRRGFTIPMCKKRTIVIGPGLSAFKATNFYEFTDTDRRIALRVLCVRLQRDKDDHDERARVAQRLAGTLAAVAEMRSSGPRTPPCGPAELAPRR